MGRITITGGAGRVATAVRPHLAAAGHAVHLLDLEPPADLAATETSQALDVTDLDALTEAVRGSDLLVHLASHADERTWPEIRDLNLESAWTAHEAAHRAGVPRVLAASSVHAVGFLPVAEAARDDVPAPRPDTLYGVSKVLLEAIGSLYADRHGHVVVSARIMTSEPEPSTARSLGTWLSPADAARLVEAALALDVPGHHVVWGVSRNTRCPVSHAAGEAIGFLARDDAEAHADRFDDADKLAAARDVLGGTMAAEPMGTRQG
ncbi:NAD-dependent epimerase/dehydratase family protein [Frigoribacterium salinisoli]